MKRLLHEASQSLAVPRLRLPKVVLNSLRNLLFIGGAYESIKEKSKGIFLQARTGSQVSRKLRLPDL
jgi:hypothetical protein